MRSHASLKHLGLWTVVCCVAAAPSFTLGVLISDGEPLQILAMLCGVAVFIAAYTVAAGTRLAQRLRRRPYVVRAMYFAYGLRMLPALAVIGFLTESEPLMYFAVPDMFCGFIGSMPLRFLGTSNASFLTFFLTTLTQGAVLNAALFVLVLVAVGVQRVVGGPERLHIDGVCDGCGYDLRASTVRCPECGTPISIVG